jgi:ABC-2 type transport system permease protein
MNGFRAMLGKELQVLYTSPLAWAVIAIFLLLTGYTFSAWLIVGQNASLVRVVHQSAVLLLLFMPVITMRTFAEERRHGTLALLLSTPVDEVALVLAKFLASLSLVCAMLIPTLLYPVLLAHFGHPDWGTVQAGYLGLLLHASALTALGLCLSALSTNQLVAAVMSLGLGMLLWVLDSMGRMLPEPFDVLVVNTSLIAHFTPLSVGVVYLSDVGYFLSITALGLLGAVRALARP